MIRFDDLSSFSRRFAQRLFEAYPQWRQYATIPDGEGWNDGVLSVVVQSPAGDRELSIDTDGDEITVGFGEHGWHAHFWAWDGLDENTVFAQAMDEIARILNDDVAILTRFVDGAARSSETFSQGEEVEFKNSDRIEICSWLGTRNATLFPA